MKKRKLKNLSLQKESISKFHFAVFGGAREASADCAYTTTIATGDPLPLTADINDCPDNSLAGDCSLGYCPETFWC